MAFNLLNNASSEFYVLAYMVMFAIPVIGLKILRRRIPTWAIVICGVGFVTSVAVFTLSAYPFDGSSKLLTFATEIIGTTLVVNLIGYAFYRARSLRARDGTLSFFHSRRTRGTSRGSRRTIQVVCFLL